jgi:hypothetical protein
MRILKNAAIATVTGLGVVVLLPLVTPLLSMTAVQLLSPQEQAPSQPRRPTTPVPLTASSWILQTVCNASLFPVSTCISPSPAAPLSNDSVGDLQFEFPGSNAAVNYLTIPWSTSLAEHGSLEIDVSVLKLSGSPIFNYAFNPNNTCVYPAHLRPYFEQKGDDGVSANYRWWANEGQIPGATYSYELDLMGNATIKVPLSAVAWSNVYGQFGNSSPAETQAFRAALADPMAIGLTFGGGCFFGHGTNVTSGTAQFYLKAYRLN